MAASNIVETILAVIAGIALYDYLVRPLLSNMNLDINNIFPKASSSSSGSSSPSPPAAKKESKIVYSYY